MHGDPMTTMALTPLPLPRPLDKLASRNEFHRWLHRIFLSIVRHGENQNIAGRMRIECPNTVVTFVHLLLYLHRVGFPPHWIADAVQPLLDGLLVTDLRPYTGKLPIPISELIAVHESKRLSLKVWQACMEVAFVTAGTALPFHLRLPPQFPESSAAIGRYKVDGIKFMTTYQPPDVPSAILVFYQESKWDSIAKGYGEMRLLRFDSWFEGIHDQHMQVYLGVDDMRIEEGVVRWRMSKERYETMRREKWGLVVFRMDMGVQGTDDRPNADPYLIHSLVSSRKSASTWTEEKLQS